VHVPHAERDGPARLNDDLVAVPAVEACISHLYVRHDAVGKARREDGLASAADVPTEVRGEPYADIGSGPADVEEEL